MPASAPEPRSRLRAVAIVPARIGSTRLERKMLLAETGLPLFAHTVRNAARAAAIEEVVVATDSAEIEAAAAAAGIRALATRADHPSGTDRALEALAALGAGRWDVVLNVQGDEPELDPADLDALVASFVDPAVGVATLAAPIANPAEGTSEDVVKVVCDARGDALYFSRAAVPSTARARDEAARGPDGPSAVRWRHVGVYAFRPEALARFCALPVGRLEALENLEQLRWLEAGERMRVVAASHAPPGIDTRADYDAFCRRHGGPGAAADTPAPKRSARAR